jgi:outer membrane protein TolC
MIRYRGLTVVFALLIGVAPAAAQAPLPLTLEAAISRGLAHAPRLAEARAREAAASSVVASRAAARAPSITATGSYLRTNHIEPFGIPQPDGTVRPLFPDLPNNYRVRAELGLPIFTSGRTEASVAFATEELRAIEAEGEVVEADVRLDVVRAYWALVTARERVRVLGAELDRMDAWVGDVRARVDAGFLPPNDILSARAQRARQNVQLIQARQGASLAEIDLARLIGVDLDQPIDAVTPVDEPLGAAADAAAQPVDALVALAREQRAERAGLLHRQEALRAAGEATLAATRPQIAGLAAVEPSRPNPRFVPRSAEWRTSWDLGVIVTWPLFDGGRARADRAVSLAQAEAAGHRLDEFDALVAVEIRQRLLDLEASRAALAAATEAVAAASEARRVVGERFDAGVATPAEVLDAQTALLETELERTQIAAALRLGEARLLRAIGGL